MVGRTGIRALLLGFVVQVAPAPGFGAEGLVVAGSGSGYYDGGEMDDLAQTILTVLYVLVEDEEDEWCSGRYHGRRPRDCYVDAEDLAFSIPKAQYDLGASAVLTPNWTVGLHALLRQDRRNEPVGLLLGIGPDATYLYLDPDSAVRPYVGAGVYATRGVSRGPRPSIWRGASFNVRAGVRVRVSDSMGYTLHAAFQRDRLGPADGDRLANKTLGIGLGLRVSLD